MKKLLKVLMVALMLLALCACSGNKAQDDPVVVPGENENENNENEPTPINDGIDVNTSYTNYEAYTQYLKPVDASLAEMGYTYWLNEETGTYLLWLDNNSEDYFARAEIYVFDDEYSEDPIFSDTARYLIRPMDFYRFGNEAFDKEPGYYDLANKEAFVLDYEKGLDYDFLYNNYDSEGYVLSIIYKGSLDDDTAMAIAKKEYIISVLSSLFETNIFIYEEGSVQYESEDTPATSSAIYNAVLDYTGKTITLYKDGAKISAASMD